MTSASTLTLARASSASAAGQVAQFHAAVSRVLADVVVTDSDGNFVENLAIEDFLLFEDGVEQKILQVELVDQASLRPTVPMGTSPSDHVAASASNAGTGDLRSRAGSLAGGSAIFFLVDGPSLFPRIKIRFAEAWKELLGTLTQTEVPHAAYLIGQTGEVQELISLTYDLEALGAAAEAVRKAPLARTSMKERLIELSNDYTVRMLRNSVKHRADAYAEEERIRSIQSLERLLRFCEAIAAQPGRKAVVWVTTGIKWDQNGPYRRLVPSGRDGDVPIPDSRVLALQDEVIRVANGWNVSVYPVDPSQTQDVRGLEFSSSAHGAGGELLRSRSVRAALDALADPLVSAAADTGGRAFIRWGDLGGALTKIVEDNSRFYILTYEPRALRGDNGYREINIEVRNREFQARGRAGFVDFDPQQRRSTLLDSALSMPGLVSGFPVDVAVGPIPQTAGQDTPSDRGWRRIRLTVAARLDGLTRDPSTEGVRTVQIAIAVIDSRGRTVWQRRAEGPQTGTELGTNGEPEATHFPFELELQPARYELRVAILSVATGNLGIDRRIIEIS